MKVLISLVVDIGYGIGLRREDARAATLFGEAVLPNLTRRVMAQSASGAVKGGLSRGEAGILRFAIWLKARRQSADGLKVSETLPA
jgi:hypothetical protein